MNPLKHIENRLLGGNRYPVKNGLTSFEVTAKADGPLTLDYNVDLLAELRVCFVQKVPPNAPSEMFNQQAKMAIARELYGDVLNRLLAIRESLWSEGVDVPSDLGALIDELNGSFTRFES